MLPVVDIQSFSDEVLNEDHPVLLAVLEPGMNGQGQAETLDLVSQSFRSRIKVLQVEESSLEAFKGRYKVMGTPTFLLFHKGSERQRLLGMADKETLARFVNRTLGWNEETTVTNH